MSAPEHVPTAATALAEGFDGAEQLAAVLGLSDSEWGAWWRELRERIERERERAA